MQIPILAPVSLVLVRLEVSWGSCHLVVRETFVPDIALAARRLDGPRISSKRRTSWRERSFGSLFTIICPYFIADATCEAAGRNGAVLREPHFNTLDLVDS